MCHQLAFWYKVMNLQIPQAATMVGGVYLWKDGREVPDTMNVRMEQPEEMLFSWDSGFGNNRWAYGRCARHRRHHRARPADPLRAAESEPAGWHRDRGQRAATTHGAHAEFSRLHPRRATSRTARSSWASAWRSPAAWRWTATAQGRTRALGCGDGRDRLATGEERNPRGFRIHPGTASSFAKPSASSPKPRSLRTSWSGTKRRLSARSHQEAGRAGLLGAIFPEEYGGAGLGYIDYSIIIEELSRVDRLGRLIVAAHNSLCTNHIYQIAAAKSRSQRYHPEARHRRMDRLLVAHRARSRLGCRAARAPPPCARATLGAQRRARPSPPTRTTPMSAWPWR